MAPGLNRNPGSSAAFPRAGPHRGAGLRLQVWPPPAVGLTRVEPVGHGPTLVLRAQPPEYSSHENVFLSLPSMRESRSSTTIPSYFCEHSLLCKTVQCPCSLLLWGASPQLHTPVPPDLGSPHASPSAAATQSCPAMLGAGPSQPPTRGRGWWAAAATGVRAGGRQPMA